MVFKVIVVMMVGFLRFSQKGGDGDGGGDGDDLDGDRYDLSDKSDDLIDNLNAKHRNTTAKGIAWVKVFAQNICISFLT